jgi:hypothetical protein
MISLFLKSRRGWFRELLAWVLLLLLARLIGG